MEQLTETITLDVEESNELAFKIKVEGASTPAKVRLVCESADVSYMFPGRGTGEDGVVQFVIPQMKGKLQEGTYAARVEVLIENRYFSPVQFQMNFKKTMQVFAESIQLVQPTAKPEIKVSAVPLVVQQQKIVQQQPIFQPAAQKEPEYVLENPFPIQKPVPAKVQQPVAQARQQKPQQVVETENKGLTLREKFMSKQFLKSKV